MERKEAIEIIRDARCTSPLRDALETLIPELRESEDEKIRKEIRDFLIDMECKKEWIAYLEKQKAPNARQRLAEWAKTEEGKAKYEEVAKEMREEIKKEQKPASTEDMPYITDEHFFEREPVDSFKYKLAKYMTQNCRKEESPDGYTYHINSESILQMAKEELIKRGELKEQKPVDRFEEAREKYQVEWSEFDKGILKDAICATDILGNDKIFNEGNPTLAKAFRIAKDWLKSLPQRFNLQPKQEWSEEDETKLNDVIRIIENCGLVESIRSHYVKFLKSLRPSWKPSEEQMEYLNDAIDNYREEDNDEAVDVLKELRKELKKLM